MYLDSAICINCGEQGHNSRSCARPITSYGVILFGQYLGETRYLMIQRKDSLAFIEFVRGKYHLGNRSYLMRLFGDMTDTERHRIETESFLDLWRSLWNGGERGRASHPYRYAEAKFYMIRRGYTIILNDDSSTPMWFDLTYLREHVPCAFHSSEWEFPKGRRKQHENILDCALREFSEETGIHHSDIRVCEEEGPFEETYIGSNGSPYKNMYFLARYLEPIQSIARIPVIEDDSWTSLIQAREVCAVKWSSFLDVNEMIRPLYAARKALFAQASSCAERRLERRLEQQA